MVEIFIYVYLKGLIFGGKEIIFHCVN